MKIASKITFTLIILMLLSCSSDDTKDNDDSGNQSLTTKVWYKDKVLIDNVAIVLPDCAREDYYDFNSDGTYEHHVFFNAGNDTDCVQFDSGEFGTYTYNPSKNKILLFLDDGVDQFEWTLIDVDITSSTLKFTKDGDLNETFERREEYKN